MYCPKCGTENPDDATSCTMCGEVLKKPESVVPGTPPPPPIGETFRPAPPPPPNYLVWSIVVTVLTAMCCFPIGIVSIVYAAQVNGKYASGDYVGATDASNKAKTWAWIAFGLWLLGVIIYAVLTAAGIMSGLSRYQRGM
jgi:hypothetical protein